MSGRDRLVLKSDTVEAFREALVMWIERRAAMHESNRNVASRNREKTKWNSALEEAETIAEFVRNAEIELVGQLKEQQQ